MAVKTAIVDMLTLHAPHLSSKQVIPAFLYGTAWKKEATTNLVFQALSNGYTAIDTACQPKHYREDLVGEGLRKAIAQNLIKRSDIYVQTKFTPIDGQDPNNVPYDSKQPIAEQVLQSIQVSLNHFAMSDTDTQSSSSSAYLDAVVLHSPMRTLAETLEVWSTLETFVPSQIRHLGISNCNLFTLMDLYERTNVKPSVVQNRFYPSSKFDVGLRKFCREKDIVYQSFWTLSANPNLLASKVVSNLANNIGVSREAGLYCLVMGLGNVVVLNGTTNEKRMQDDIGALKKAKKFAETNSDAWQEAMSSFRKLIGEPASL